MITADVLDKDAVGVITITATEDGANIIGCMSIQQMIFATKALIESTRHTMQEKED